MAWLKKTGTLYFLALSIAHSFPAQSYAESVISKRSSEIKAQEKIIENSTGNTLPGIKNDAALNDYITLGIQNNPGLKAAFYAWKLSFAKISQAFSLPDPQFTYTKYVEAVETRVGPQKNSFSMSQKIPFPDKLWIRRTKAFKTSEEAYYTYHKKCLALINEITEAYYEYAYLHKAILLTNENIRLLKNFESVTQAKYTTGLAQNQDLLKVQVELGKLENELLSLEDLRQPLVARLNSLLYLPHATLLPWPNETLEDITIEQGYTEIHELTGVLEKNNFELLALSENVAKNKDALRLAQKNYIPDVTLGVTTIDTKNAVMPNSAESGKDPWMVMVSINVPLWFNRLHAEAQEAKSSLQAAENVWANKQSELLSQLALVHYKLRDALRQSHLYKDALLPKAAQALHATQSGYESGKTDFLSLIDAQKVLLNFQLAYYRQNTNFYQRLAELKSLLGEYQPTPSASNK